ncbi:MAG: tryptophan synthase subunit alpha, partial [Candidatus Aenigmarchaeota archaeon]|nr:tryptophan synthase subunit alpha [Candidatus Aenigmarchaeota archaeon]
DGVIVGSAIVKIIEKNLNDVDKMIKEIKEFVEDIGRNISQ